MGFSGFMQKGGRVVVLAVLIGLVGCSPTKSDTGAVLGGVLGGVLGSQVKKGDPDTNRLAVLLGTLGGAIVGQAIGRTMDEYDQQQAAHALDQAPPMAPTGWTNTTTDTRWAITAGAPYDRSPEGGDMPRECRQYQLIARDATSLSRAPTTVVGTACRDAAGTWVLEH